MTEGPGGALKGISFAAPPIRGFEVLKPVKTTELRPGITVYDLGQNASQMPKITVHGPPGQRSDSWPAELLKADGSVDQGSTGSPRVLAFTPWRAAGGRHGRRGSSTMAAAICKSSAPRRRTGARRPWSTRWKAAWCIPSAPPVGEFACSNELFNRIHLLVRWAQRSNMMSVMTDCPHRERLGWLEQDHLNGPALRYEFDLERLMAKTVNDMADAQQPDGLVPSIAPEYVIFTDGFRDSPEWGSACVLIPWQQYEWTGDVALLRRSYDMMKRYLAHLGSRAEHHLVDLGLGDWYDIGPGRPGIAQLTPIALTATAFYYDDARIVARVAGLLGRPNEARQYQELAAQIRTAFNQAFFDPAKGRYATGSQCADAIPLVMGLAEPEHRASVLAALVKDVRDRGNALTVGDVGYRYLLRALADGGDSDVIYAMNNQSDKPGYGFQLKRGATSLTEAWDADPRASQNHFMLGQINEWFYHDLAGIQSDPRRAGLQADHHPARGRRATLTFVKASYDSVHGRIPAHGSAKAGGSPWRRHPANTTATVFIPTRAPPQP